MKEEEKAREVPYLYRIERITHRPNAEDKITLIKEVREKDLELARVLATKIYWDELKELEGKYSPGSFELYDTRKGIGFNYQLLLCDTYDEEVYLVESSMEKIAPAVLAQRKEEKKIFEEQGLDFSNFEM